MQSSTVLVFVLPKLAKILNNFRFVLNARFVGK